MNRVFSTIVLLLLAASLRLSAAETNHNFGKWENEIAAYEASDRTNPPPKHAIEFTGSSVIRKWTTLKRDFPNQPVFDRGVGGTEIVDITHFADRIVFPYEPKVIVFRCGGNDIAAGKSPEQVYADFKEFAAAVRAKLPETDIVFIAWSPTIARWRNKEKEETFNNLVHDFIKQTPHLKYCDASDVSLGADGKPRPDLFVKDGLHFNAAGYKLLTARVRPFLPQ